VHSASRPSVFSNLPMSSRLIDNFLSDTNSQNLRIGAREEEKSRKVISWNPWDLAGTRFIWRENQT